MLAGEIGVSVDVVRWKVLGWLVRATVEKETKAHRHCRHTAVAYSERCRYTAMRSLMLPSARFAPAMSAAVMLK